MWVVLALLAILLFSPWGGLPQMLLDASDKRSDRKRKRAAIARRREAREKARQEGGASPPAGGNQEEAPRPESDPRSAVE